MSLLELLIAATIPSVVKARSVPTTTTTTTTTRCGKIPKIMAYLSCSAKPLVAHNLLGPK